jgi:CheY-like chemotaxis protein/curved DNA-binding protein CbpA
MSDKKAKILIIEDDLTLGPALEKALLSRGFDVKVVTRADDALNFATSEPHIDALIVDCMLPKLNGVDLSIKLKETIQGEPIVLLISGVFKERSFIDEAIAKTGATEFLVKPFELEDIILLLENLLAPLAEEQVRSPLSRLLMLKENDINQQIEVISDLDSLHSFDLPTVYSLLMDSAVTGHLNIIDSEGNVSGVGFKNGFICQVDVKNSTSFFVSLLIEKGFIFPGDVEQALAIPSRKRIGERLVEANILSPHAIEVVVKDQMAILLSKTVKESNSKITLVLSDTIQGDIKLSKSDLLRYFHDWTTSKFTLNWLRSRYLQWLDNPIRKGTNFKDWKRLSTFSLFSGMPDLFKVLEKGSTLSHILDTHKFNEIDTYRAIHLLTITRVITFDSVVQTIDSNKHQERLEKLKTAIKTQDYYEILGIDTKASQSDIERAYKELHKLAAPELLPNDASEEFKRIASDVFKEVLTAYTCLMDGEQRAAYNHSQKAARAEILLKAEALFSEGKAYLKKNMISKAAAAFEASASLSPASPELQLHLIWTRIKSMEADNKLTPENLSKIEGELNRIPPEEQHNSTYYYVQGLFLICNGNTKGARKNFEHILAQDPNFIEAKRELSRIKLASEKKSKDILSTDVKEVFGMLFKRKKTG